MLKGHVLFFQVNILNGEISQRNIIIKIFNPNLRKKSFFFMVITKTNIICRFKFQVVWLVFYKLSSG